VVRTALQKMLETEMREAVDVARGERAPARLGYRFR
jgi:hypothetical protein